MRIKLSFLVSVVSCLLYAQSAPSYYSGVNFTKKGNALKEDLANLITNTHSKVISYSELQTLMKTSDVDPSNPSNLLLIYGSEASGTHQRSRPKGGSWNREHVYAKSKGTPNLGTSGPGADGHHLRPADTSLNSTRGSLLFDDGAGAKAYKTSRGGWFPGDEWKGDVARILMYMYVRYNSRALPLNITMNPNTYSPDFPDILLKWNVEDPVSAFEIQRNNVVAQTQKNRNPFIDNPYLATVIWGGPAAQNNWPDTFNGGTAGDIEAPTAPSQLTVTAKAQTSVSLSWKASTDNLALGSYEVYVNGLPNITVFHTEATITGLAPATSYTFYVIARDTSGNRSAASNVAEATTTTPPTGVGTTCGTEDFNNISGTSSSYTDKSWNNNGINWTATSARNDSPVYIDGSQAICMKNGTLKSSVISGGIGTLSVKTYLPFSDTSATYTLKINGVEKGKITATKTAQTVTVTNINVAGDFTIELVADNSSGVRMSIDDLSWTCFSALSTDQSAVKSNKIKIHPNPVRNSEFSISGIGHKETVSVYSLSGQLLQRFDNVNNQQKIVLKKLAKGVYFVTTKTQSAKLIID